MLLEVSFAGMVASENTSHIKVRSRVMSVYNYNRDMESKLNFYTECPQGMTCLGFGRVSFSSSVS